VITVTVLKFLEKNAGFTGKERELAHNLEKVMTPNPNLRKKK